MNRREIMMACSAKKAVIYTITANITNGSIDKTSISAGESLEITLTPSSGYKLPTDAPTASNGTISGYDSTTGKFTLSGVTANTTITTECPIISYTIITTVTNGTYSGATEIVSGGTATVTITPNSGYKLPDSVSVSGATSSYDSTTGVINLSNPTSDVTITVSCPSAAVKFSEDSWENIAANCEALENGGTEDEFCSKYLKDDGSEITSMNDFVGLTHKISIDNVEHTVRVIGTQHDTISGGTTKAALTFQLVELFSDSTDAAITQKWNASYDDPYYNIWFNGTQSCDIRNYLRTTFKGYLPSEVQSAIKTIKKKTSAGKKSTTVNELEEDIFLLSLHEMASETGISNSSATWITDYASTLNQEGTPYKYYNDVLGDIDPRSWNTTPYSNVTIKKDLAGTAKVWWMRSPYLDDSIRAFRVYSTGYVNYSLVNNTGGVAPAFCI